MAAIMDFYPLFQHVKKRKIYFFNRASFISYVQKNLRINI